MVARGVAKRALGAKKSRNWLRHRPMGARGQPRNHTGRGGNMSYHQKLGIGFSILLAGCAVDTSSAPEGTEAAPESVGQSEAALCGKNALTKPQQETVLKLIDDICGDTWCEGDNNFAFERLHCQSGGPRALNGGTCTLTLRIIPRVDTPPAYVRSCITPGYLGFSSLVDTASNGYQSLNWDYYLALTDCISQLEAALPH